MSTSSENTGSLASMADPNAASTVDNNPSDVPPTPPAAAKASPVPSSTKMQTVRLSNERSGEALPQGRVNIGRVSIEIPAPEEQTAGFQLPKEQAAVLVPQFGQYKFVTEKGTRTPPVAI